MRFPGGAVRPLMKPITGFPNPGPITSSAAASSSLPPISPIMTTARVAGSFWKSPTASLERAEHNHGTGGWIVLEEPQDLLERKPEDGIAADPHRGRLPHPRLAQSLDDFIGQGATPRHDAHRTLAVDVAGDDAHLGLSRGHQPQTVQPDGVDC